MLSKDDRFVVTGDLEGSVKVVNIQTKELIHEFSRAMKSIFDCYKFANSLMKRTIAF